MSDSRNSYLLKNTAIFTLGNLATRLIAFFLVPLYTNVLSTSEYGTVDLVATISTIAVPIITLNIMEAVMRFNLDKGADRNRITKIGIVVLFCGAIVGLLVIPITSLWDKVSGYSILIYFYVICSASSQVFLCDLRGKELLVNYSIGNILNTFLIAVFNLVFLLIFKWRIRGYLLAYTLASAIVAVYALVVGKGYRAIKESIDTSKMKEMLTYSVVLIPNSFMWWIMNSSDHIMVTSMVGVAANGIYAISYKLPTLISTLLGIFNQAWSYSAIKEDDSEDVAVYTNNVFRTMIGIIMLAGLGMMTFIKPFLRIYVSSEYFAAWKYTPYLIIGCVFMTLGTFMSTSYTVHKDSKGFLMSGSIGALINITLNVLLIPIMEVTGAALATCVSYMSVFAFRAVHTRKYMKYRFYTKEFIIGVIALFTSACLMFSDYVAARICQLVIFIIVCIMFKNIWLPFTLKVLKIKRH